MASTVSHFHWHNSKIVFRKFLGFCINIKENDNFQYFTSSLCFSFNIKSVLCGQPWFLRLYLQLWKHRVQTATLTLSLSVFRLQRWPFPSGVGQCCGRGDVLQQGEHESGRPWQQWMHCGNYRYTEEKHVAGCDLQKRTWESNKNDIRICRMKGKHEVRQLY